MSAYLVKITNPTGKTFKNGANAVLVEAASETLAKQMAASYFDGDGGAWTTDAVVVTAAAAADWAGWTFTAVILGTVPKVFTVVADATTNTIDEIAAALVVLANADAGIANASYDSITNVLTVAGSADNLGNLQLQMDITPPGGFSPVAALVGAIVDGGSAAAALTVTLPADAATVPAVIAPLSTT